MKKERILKYLILICAMVVSFFIFANDGVNAFDYSVNENNFKIVSDKRNATLNRENRKPPVRTRTKRITDLINKANKRKGK